MTIRGRNKRIRKTLTENFLTKEYLKNKQSIRQIAKKVNFGYDAVRNNLIRHGIKLRSMSEGNKLINRKGRKSHLFKGRSKTAQGYVRIYVEEFHPYKNKQNYVYEHRLVVESQIGRYLKPKEMIHHLNKITDDNRPENLMAFADRLTHVKFETEKEIDKRKIIFDGRNL